MSNGTDILDTLLTGAMGMAPELLGMAPELLGAATGRAPATRAGKAGTYRYDPKTGKFVLVRRRVKKIVISERNWKFWMSILRLTRGRRVSYPLARRRRRGW